MALLKTIESTSKLLEKAKQELSKSILGQDDLLDLSMATILAGGHLLLVGVPGLAKTKLSKDLATVFSLDNTRIQCTPDLMPADILGSEILEEQKNKEKYFKFVKGPVFTNLLLADEINRSSPRTQSALLEAMQENMVTVSGERYELPIPFHVIATQNPIEQEGTYPLPEAQLDRFLMQVTLHYPDQKFEKQILLETTQNTHYTVESKIKQKELLEIQKLVKELPIGDKLVDQIVTLIRELRPETSQNKKVQQHVKWGPGTRAGQSFMNVCRAYALIKGREAPLLEDLIALAKPILSHRLSLSFSAKAEGITNGSLIEEIVDSL